MRAQISYTQKRIINLKIRSFDFVCESSHLRSQNTTLEKKAASKSGPSQNEYLFVKECIWIHIYHAAKTPVQTNLKPLH